MNNHITRAVDQREIEEARAQFADVQDGLRQEALEEARARFAHIQDELRQEALQEARFMLRHEDDRSEAAFSRRTEVILAADCDEEFEQLSEEVWNSDAFRVKRDEAWNAALARAHGQATRAAVVREPPCPSRALAALMAEEAIMGYPSHLRERLGKFIYNHMFRGDAEGSSMLPMLESLRERDFDDADAIRWKADIVGLLGGNVLQAFASLSSEERSKLKHAIWELFNWLGPDDVGPEGEKR